MIRLVILILSFGLFFNFFTLKNCQSTIAYYPSCNCDLLPVCDMNCCCDTQCQSSDLVAFNCKNDTNTNNDKKWCVPRDTLFLENTPYIIYVLGDLVCIDVNNSVSLNYYDVPLLDFVSNKEDYINQIVNSLEPKLIERPPLFAIDLASNQTGFTNKDYIWLVFLNRNPNVANTLGFLSLPKQTGAECSPGVPLNMYTNKLTSCVVSKNTIANQCADPTALTTLNLQYFKSDFKIIKTPKSLASCYAAAGTGSGSTATSFDYFTKCDSKYLTPINIIACVLEDGTPVPNCDKLTPASDAQNGCNYLVKSLIYVMRYNYPDGIIEAGVYVIFFNYKDANIQQVEQTFRVAYVPSGIQLSEINTNYAVELSGNPGYLKGKPIIVGLSNDPNSRLRFNYLVSNTRGICPNDDSLRKPIKFGFNLFSECFIDLKDLNPNLSSFCNDLQTNIDNIILGYAKDKRPDVFAPFTTTNSTLWPTILNSQPKSNPISNANGLGGVCNSLRTSTTIQIAYALEGNFENPQAKIVYVSYDWSQTTDINLRCYNQICANLNNFKLKITTRVIFVDVSQAPIQTEGKISKPKTNLPGDFFYPLSSLSIRSNKPNSAFMHLTILVVFIQFIFNYF